MIELSFERKVVCVETGLVGNRPVWGLHFLRTTGASLCIIPETSCNKAGWEQAQSGYRTGEISVIVSPEIAVGEGWNEEWGGGEGRWRGEVEIER